jgi:integrative and conjugative element protein (TIGR02256 family)
VRFKREQAGTLLLEGTALEQMHRHRQVAPESCEAGGILLGRMILGTADVIVDEAAGPAATDRRSRASFKRTAEDWQAKVDGAWESSRHAVNYLGEWHTHPEPVPSPSVQDLEEWQRIAVEAKYEQDSLFFVIVGTVETAAWEVERETGAIVALGRDTQSQA